MLALIGEGDRRVASRRSGAWPTMVAERRGKGCARVCTGDAGREGSVVVGCCYGEGVRHGVAWGVFMAAKRGDREGGVGAGRDGGMELLAQRPITLVLMMINSCSYSTNDLVFN